VSGRIPFLPSKAVFPVVEVTAHLVLESLVAPQAHQSPIRIKAHRQARCRVGRFAPGGFCRPRKPSVPRRVQSFRDDPGTGSVAAPPCPTVL